MEHLAALLKAAFLGLVEGVTEFLPISSTGHLILFVDLLKFEGPSGKVFEVVIQLGAILAVMWLYRARIYDLLLHAWRPGVQQRFTLALIAAVIPAVVFGAALHHFVKEHLYNPTVVACALILGGVAILVIERLKPAPRILDSEQITWKRGFLIGLGQAVALIPGVSRSGATMMAGLLLGVERRAAAEFSFFLAMPTMMLATVYDLYKSGGSLDGDGWTEIAIGFFVAFLVALLVVRALLRFLSTHGFAPFAYYRILLGTVILALAYLA